MKIWGWVILAGILVAALTAGTRAIYVAGYNKRDNEVVREIAAAEEAARLKEAELWRKTVEEAEAEIIVEEKIVEVIRTVEKKVPRVVEKIVEVKPECRDLGLGYAGLLNQQVRGANGTTSTENTPALAEGVPGT